MLGRVALVQPLLGKLHLPHGKADAFVALGGGDKRLRNVAPLPRLGEVERQRPVVAGRDLLDHLLPIPLFQVTGEAFGVILMLELDAAVFTMDRRQ